ncbi:MAG: hypothetical protein ACM3X7_07185 [Solirubrobacterales bacterium]
MKKLSILLIVLLLFAGCSKANKTAEKNTENLNVEPFNERRFIYTNSLQDETKHLTVKENGVNVEKSYPIIHGMLNKELQEKINSSILNTMEQNLKDLETQVMTDSSLSPYTVTGESNSAYITYNCNNVIFVEYYANMDIVSKSIPLPKQKIKSVGYELNTGSLLSLKDLFIENSNYEKFINDFITLYIIKNNYDDPEGNIMTGPFKGISNEQSFSFDLYGVRIILDEKNSEFAARENPNFITIPLKDSGPYLAIFDRYYQGKPNIFEKHPRKQLLQNQVEFKINSFIRESKSNYDISVENGEFNNLESIETKQLFDSFVKGTQDINGFRARAQASKDNWYGSLGHTISVGMNAGGYISIMVLDNLNEKASENEVRRYLNYNLIKNHVMKLKDVFTEGFNYKKAISDALLTNKDDYTFKTVDISKLSEDNFYFSEDSVTVYLNIAGRKQFQNYFTIPFDKLGYENVSLYK